LLPFSVTGEEERLASLLQAAPGKTMAEIGAGKGAFSVALAQRLQPGGTLYSTELNPERRQQIRERVERQHARNVVVVEAGETTTNLPDGCCDAIFMRNVYHHIGDPERFNASLRRAIRPGGRLAIIDFEPGVFWHLWRRPEGANRERTGHGVGWLAVARELQRAGFRVERVVDDWGGRLYLVLLEAPGSAIEQSLSDASVAPAPAN
jgi:ubiquinone/menaquinone biosynthesis C-methylase UbiE